MTQSAVIVTGVASGIGYACAHDLLTDGVPVVAADIGEIPAALVNAGDCLPLSFDVSSEQSCQEAVATATARFGGVRALIHFAGIHHTKTWDEFTGEDFAHVYAVNVTGFFLIARCGRANAGLRWIYRAHRVGRCVAWRRRRRWSGRSSRRRRQATHRPTR